MTKKTSTPRNPPGIQALVRGQIFKEPGVARTPSPTVLVTPITGSGPAGGLSLAIRYAAADTSGTQSLSFSVEG